MGFAWKTVIFQEIGKFEFYFSIIEKLHHRRVVQFSLI